MGGIQMEFELAAPPENVWPLLTDRAQLAAWFMETDFVADVGHRFMIWPGPGLPAVDGPISAVVLAMAAPRSLVMGWQSPKTQTEMAWTLQASPQGTRLGVAESGHVGMPGIARERALAQLFDVNLRHLLEGSAVVLRAASMADPAPITDPPATSARRADARAANRSGYSPGVASVSRGYAALGVAPDDRTGSETYTRDAVWLVVVLSTVVLALVVFGFVWPPIPTAGDRLTAGRAGSLGTSPVGSPDSMPVGSPGSSPVVATAVDPGGGPRLGSARLTVSSTYTSMLTEHVVTVAITNDGDTAGHWTSAAVVLGSVDLIVTPSGSEVSQTSHGSTHCFYPTAPASLVPAGGSYAFRFTITLGVTATLSGDPVMSATLDSGAC
jgi:uncharacterized protein YndB with AHSA1/START domain